MIRLLATIKIRDGENVLRVDSLIQGSNIDIFFKNLCHVAKGYMKPGNSLESIYFCEEEVL